MTKLLLLVSLALASSGCATALNGTAPAARPGWQYSVGMWWAFPRAWICPDQPGQGECIEIEVKEVRR